MSLACAWWWELLWPWRADLGLHFQQLLWAVTLFGSLAECSKAGLLPQTIAAANSRMPLARLKSASMAAFLFPIPLLKALSRWVYVCSFELKRHVIFKYQSLQTVQLGLACTISMQEHQCFTMSSCTSSLNIIEHLHPACLGKGRHMFDECTHGTSLQWKGRN